MKKVSLEQELKGNAYPGRGIVIGRSKDGTKALPDTYYGQKPEQPQPCLC